MAARARSPVQNRARDSPREPPPVCCCETLHPRLALRAKGARARDSTVYGGSSTSAKSFFVHHTQQLAAAAQVGDANKGIRKKMFTEMKMRLIKDALKATGRG